jgi:hypothetical protein
MLETHAWARKLIDRAIDVRVEFAFYDLASPLPPCLTPSDRRKPWHATEVGHPR